MAFPITKLPLTIPGLIVWYDANVTSSITITSGRVSQWNDLSGKGNHATQSTSGDRPAYTANVQNGNYGVSFSGGDYMLMNGGSGFTPDLTSGAVTFMMVGDSNVGPSASFYMFLGSSSTSDRRVYIFQNLTSGFITSVIKDSVDGDIISNVLANSTPIIKLSYDGSTNTETLQINGNTFLSTLSIDFSGTPTNFYLAGTPSTSSVFYMNGWIGDLVCFNRILTSDEKTSLFRYYSNKWGTAIT